MSEPASEIQLVALEGDLDLWLADQVDENPAVLTVERGVDGPRSWFVRMQGEEKDAFTIRFHLRQRTLWYETHFLPAPEENRAEIYEYLLRRNAKWYGSAFTIGEEDAIYVTGQVGLDLLDVEEVDRVLGSVYTIVEQCFRPALRLAFASRLSVSPGDSIDQGND